MDDRRGLLESDAVAMQQHPNPLGTHHYPSLPGKVPGQQRAGPRGLIESLPAGVVANGLDQHKFVLLVPANRPTITVLGGEGIKPTELEAVEPTVDATLVNAE